MEKITAFQCGYCPKIYNNPKQTGAHEKKCYHNPASKSCATCQNYLGLEYCVGRDQPFCSLDPELRKLQTGCAKHVTHPDFLVI